MAATRAARVRELLEAFERNGNLMILFTNALAQRVGLSATEFECLSLLRQGPLTAGRLAELCGLTTGAMTGLIDRLERAGFAERGSDPTDRRRVLVRLAARPDGPQLRERIIGLYDPLSKSLDELTQGYSDTELAVLYDFTLRMNGIFEQLTAQFAEEAKRG